MLLKYGDRRPEVEILQRALKAKGLYRAKLDSIYDVRTQRAVSELQRHSGLPIDGQADEAVLRMLGLLDRPKSNKDDKTSLLSIGPLTRADKADIVTAVSAFIGDFTTCGRGSSFSRGDEAVPWYTGLRFGLFQFSQDSGDLGCLLRAMRERKPTIFDRTFGMSSSELVRVTNLPGLPLRVEDSTSSTGFVLRSPRVVPIEGADLWKEPWLSAFSKAGEDPDFQQVQVDVAIQLYFDPMLERAKGVMSEKGLAILLDRYVDLGKKGYGALFRNMPSWSSEREWFELLYERNSTKEWAFRLRTLLDSEQVSWFKRFE